MRWAALIVPFGALCAAQLLGRVVPALERTAKVAEILPGDAEAQLKFAKALHEQNRVDEAIAHYKDAIAAKPSFADAEMWLGLALGDKGDLDGAKEHYERALSLNPKNALAECNYAGVLVLKREVRGRAATLFAQLGARSDAGACTQRARRFARGCRRDRIRNLALRGSDTPRSLV